MDDVARIVLGVGEHDVAEEVMHFLDRSGNARVVATASDDRQLAAAVRQEEPDAVIASPHLVTWPRVSGVSLLALDSRESVAGLRAAMRAGAEGYFVWPSDRDALAAAATGTMRGPREDARTRGRVVAVYPARGGAGGTFVATHLAAALARRDCRCIVVDLDRTFAELTTALGVSTDEPVRTVADLVPLGDDVSPEHLDGALWPHPEGFRALFAPAIEEASVVGVDAYRAVLDTTSKGADVAVLHLPRALDDVSRMALSEVDRVLIVLTLDVMSFRNGKRALSLLRDLGVEERCDFVVNRAARAEIVPNDVRRAFGKPPVAVIRADRRVAPAQDRGRLMPARSRAVRSIDKLASTVLEVG